MNQPGAAAQGAETERFGNEPERAAGPGPGPTLMGATTLVGDPIFNDKGERLGELKQIMLDMHSGRVAYALRKAARAAKPCPDNPSRYMDVAKELLESAPGFDPDRWPDMADPIWAAQIHSYYGTKRYDDGTL